MCGAEVQRPVKFSMSYTAVPGFDWPFACWVQISQQQRGMARVVGFLELTCKTWSVFLALVPALLSLCICRSLRSGSTDARSLSTDS